MREMGIRVEEGSEAQVRLQARRERQVVCDALPFSMPIVANAPAMAVVARKLSTLCDQRGVTNEHVSAHGPQCAKSQGKSGLSGVSATI
jgi:hypothetical protein